MPSFGRLIQKFNERIATRKDELGPKLEDWSDRGHDPSGDLVKSRPACGACNSTGAACGHEGCGCCPHCNKNTPT